MRRMVAVMGMLAGAVSLVGCGTAGEAQPTVTVTVTATPSPDTVSVPVPADTLTAGPDEWELQQQLDDAAKEAGADAAYAAKQCRDQAEFGADAMYEAEADGWGMSQDDLGDARQRADQMAQMAYDSCMATRN